MADVFLSYKREDIDFARNITQALTESGISVWWDDQITPREAWDAEIERAIAAAPAVAVLWSPRSVTSEWVRTEAHFAKDRQKLVPALIEPCTLPIAFALTQTVNLAGWGGNRDDRQWRKLLAWISELVAITPGSGSAQGVSVSTPNRYRDSVGTFRSGEPIYDGAFITPSTPAGTLFRDATSMPVMRVLAKGSFLLGASSDDPDHSAFELPQKRIDIPAAFAMSVFPVLMSEYAALIAQPVLAPVQAASQRSWLERFRKGPVKVARATDPEPLDPNLPIINVSCDEAQSFAERLAAASGQRYRIPSEAEWEYACRSGSSTLYACGDTIDSNQAAFGLACGPVAVGNYAPNRFGLYDMHGNVREWTADLWHDSYDWTPPDGRPALDGHSAMRVVRGGSWHDSPAMLRSAARMRATQSIKSALIGFRVVRSIN
ncbi:MAG: SUMF1/EgtB/PvdO family nonheme iron enzyme [Acidobacteriaceae bacterium]|nr:SUMF1/EgtB/PvdO family nonheme iron enzyme [Acidobacteriaceae bacterium]